jgi:hypothetical protein
VSARGCPVRGGLPDRKQALLGENYTLDGGAVLPGFMCRVGDLFPA